MSKIVLSHKLYKPGMDLLNESGNELIIPDNGNCEEIIDFLKDSEAFILRIGKIDRAAIESCPKLKVITRPGVGVDNVDVVAATEHGIPVVICSGVNAQSVAEHTLSLVFAISKNLVESDNETRKGNFGIRNKYVAVEVSGKTLSLLGFGNIGRIVAKLAIGIGMKVVVYDPYWKKEDVEKFGFQYSVSLENAVKVGDFVSLHMPSLPATREMIDESFFLNMKKSAFLINCARGDLVNEKALYKALKTKIISGAAVDVLTKEPMDLSSPLMELDNFIVTPHMAGQTKEATAKIVTMAVQGTLAVLNGEKWEHVCNPEVYNHPRWNSR